MTSAGGYHPAQPRQVILFAVLLHFWFWLVVCYFSQLSAELRKGIYAKKKNFAVSEQAEEVKLSGPPQQPMERSTGL